MSAFAPKGKEGKRLDVIQALRYNHFVAAFVLGIRACSGLYRACSGILYYIRLKGVEGQKQPLESLCPM